MLNLSKEAKVIVVEGASVAGTTTVVSDIIDMQGYDSVCFIGLLGEVLDTAVIALNVKGNSANHLTVPTPTAYAGGAGGTATATSADNKSVITDVNKPRDRYVWAELVRGTANVVVNGIIAILYNGSNRPNLPDATNFATAFLNDPSA